MLAKPIDLSIIKEGLEYAQFADFRVRDAMNRVIKELQHDLDDVGFEPAPQTTDAIKELEELYLEIQTAGVKLKRPKTRMDDEEDIEVRKKDTIEEFADDIIEFRPKSGIKEVKKDGPKA